METLSPEEWQKQLNSTDKAQVIDVRSDEEYNEKHIPHARLIDVQDPRDFMGHIEKLDKEKDYFIYCNSGNRGNQACLVMDYNGFQNTYNLEGGIEAWEGPTEKK